MKTLATATFSSGLFIGLFWNSSGTEAFGAYLLLVAAIYLVINLVTVGRPS